MRLRHPDGSTLHLAYCTNVHPAEDIDGIIGQLDGISGRVRARLDVPLLGVGLWIPAKLAGALRGDPEGVNRLREALTRNGLETVTLNGFPYGGFHDDVVKHAVYRPDWSEGERLAYTIDLADLLARILPDDVTEGTISTLPLGWATWMDDAAVKVAEGALVALGDRLTEMERETGRRIRIGLEPEPGCVLDSADKVLSTVERIASPAIGLALDACHLAVEFEEVAALAARLSAAGDQAVKMQVSSALRLAEDEVGARLDRLAGYAEPRFLHQVRQMTPTGVAGVNDIDEVGGALRGMGEWRVHFHTPVHHGGAETTQDLLVAALEALIGGSHPLTHVLEIETYTWTVLPADRRPASDDELVTALALEMAWTRDRLVELGCEEVG